MSTHLIDFGQYVDERIANIALAKLQEGIKLTVDKYKKNPHRYDYEYEVNKITGETKKGSCYTLWMHDSVKNMPWLHHFLNIKDCREGILSIYSMADYGRYVERANHCLTLTHRLDHPLTRMFIVDLCKLKDLPREWFKCIEERPSYYDSKQWQELYLSGRPIGEFLTEVLTDSLFTRHPKRQIPANPTFEFRSRSAKDIIENYLRRSLIEVSCDVGICDVSGKYEPYFRGCGCPDVPRSMDLAAWSSILEYSPSWPKFINIFLSTLTPSTANWIWNLANGCPEPMQELEDMNNLVDLNQFVRDIQAICGTATTYPQFRAEIDTAVNKFKETYIDPVDRYPHIIWQVLDLITKFDECNSLVARHTRGYLMDGLESIINRPLTMNSISEINKDVNGLVRHVTP